MFTEIYIISLLHLQSRKSQIHLISQGTSKNSLQSDSPKIIQSFSLIKMCILCWCILLLGLYFCLCVLPYTSKNKVVFSHAEKLI